jgi:ribose transport system substrate-binding protein
VRHSTSHRCGPRRAPGRALLHDLGMAVLVAAALGGCSKKSPEGGAAATAGKAGSTPRRIGVTLLTMQHGFYQELRAGLEKAARQRGYDLVVTTGEFDAARQANQIDEFIVQKLDAIVVCPCDSRSVGASIAQANSAGIPVFTADIASTSPLGKVVAHVASDNQAGGRKAAELMLAALGGKGKVAILSHPEVTSVADRVAGFKAGLASQSGVEIVAELSAEGKRDRAVKVMEDLLQSHPDLNGVFGINDDSALGALAAVEAAGKLGKIAIVGYDATPEARAKIDAGALYGDVVQDPRRIGELTLEAIDGYFHGNPPASFIPVPVGAYLRGGH